MTQIVFNSQEEFENAVMDVLDKRLQIKLDTYDEYGDRFLEAILSDTKETTTTTFCVIDYDSVTLGVAY